VTRRLALRDPATAGVKITLIVQFDPIAREELQLFVCEKSPGFVPVIAMLVMFRAAVPVFDSVTARAVLGLPTVTEPNETEVGENCTTGANGAEVKLTLVALALFTMTFRLVGVNANPVLLGVTVYDPLVSPVKI
jgi:hypothetical protein